MTQRTRRVTRVRPLALRTALLGCSLALAAPAARAQRVEVFKLPGGETRVVTRGDDDRPVIGVMTISDSERADTLGVRIDRVQPGSPAEKAGIKAGDRIQAVNGVSLRADRADAGEEDYAGVLTRRLQRAVQATKPGDAVTLRVLSGGSARDVRVTPVKASELEEERPTMTWSRTMDGDRAVLGLATSATGSVRDTLGVFVQSVVKDGPAEKAGIIEGDRIAAINRVSLRVAREDAEDHGVSMARAERLSREVAKLKAGDVAELTVVTAGRSRTVRVTAVKASELPQDDFAGMLLRAPGMGMFRDMPQMQLFRTPDMDETMEMPELQGLRRMQPLPFKREQPTITLRDRRPGTLPLKIVDRRSNRAI